MPLCRLEDSPNRGIISAPVPVTADEGGEDAPAAAEEDTEIGMAAEEEEEEEEAGGGGAAVEPIPPALLVLPVVCMPMRSSYKRGRRGEGAVAVDGGKRKGTPGVGWGMVGIVWV